MLFHSNLGVLWNEAVLCSQKKHEDLIGFGVTALNVSRTSLESDSEKLKATLFLFFIAKEK